VYQLAFSPDGHQLVSAGADQTVRLWHIPDASVGQPEADTETVFTPNTHVGPISPREHINGVGAVAFSPDGRVLATGAQTSQDYAVRLWDITVPARPVPVGNPMLGHTSFISGLSFSPDGHTLASSSADHTVRLWDVTDPRHPGPAGEPLRSHTNSVTSVAYSPDGHTLATGGDDHTVQLWDVTDPAHAAPLGRALSGHAGPVRSIAFSPDGTTLVSASRDSTVRVWDPSTDAAITRICSSTAHTFTQDQWNEFVSTDLPYQPPCGPDDRGGQSP
jgi:dipeptidyl aminopeptidase/acylaminoacyl peptidase